MVRLGHEVRLIAPQYVKPFVKRQKNDAADAEAIVIAAQRPEIRFVEPKSEEQQTKAVLFRARKRLVHQRTELVNALRANTAISSRKGLVTSKRIEAILKESNSGLPELVREECRDLIDQIAQKTERIEAKTGQLKKLAAQTGTARRLQTMPGVGPLTALAIEAFGPDMANVAVTSQPGWAWSRSNIPQGARRGSDGFPKKDKPTFASCSSSGRCHG